MKTPQSPELLHAIEHEGLEAGAGHWSLADYVSELASPESRLFFVPGAAEGFVLYRDVAGDVEIMNLAVRVKGQGHGRFLLEKFFAALFSGGPQSGRKVFLEVAASNVPARKLYESLGFEKTGVRKAYYRSGEDALTYVKDTKESHDQDV
jgi:ribosomal-protein-alanine N-acetyltransferase